MNTISLYNRLATVINEETFADLKDKQDSDIVKLFPIFPQRVVAVKDAGGSHMAKTKPPDTWHFRIASVSNPGTTYNAYLKFKNLDDEISTGTRDKENWKVDKSGVDLRKLSADILANVDIEVGCSCPADLYWGGKYIRTQRGSNYGRPETRPPVKRNPGKHGAYCKHLDVLIQTLPFYHGDMAKFLNTFYIDDIHKIEQEVLNKGKKKKAEPKKEVKKEEPKKPERKIEVKKPEKGVAKPTGEEPKEEPKKVGRPATKPMSKKEEK